MKLRKPMGQGYSGSPALLSLTPCALIAFHNALLCLLNFPLNQTIFFYLLDGRQWLSLIQFFFVFIEVSSHPPH